LEKLGVPEKGINGDYSSGTLFRIRKHKKMEKGEKRNLKDRGVKKKGVRRLAANSLSVAVKNGSDHSRRKARERLSIRSGFVDKLGRKRVGNDWPGDSMWENFTAIMEKT